MFQTAPKLFNESYRVESGVSSDSLQLFVGAVAEMNDANVWDLSQLCDEFSFIELAKTVGDWQSKHSLADVGIGHGLDLVQAALERLESHACTMWMLDRALNCRRETGMNDTEKRAAVEAEVSGLSETTARDVHLVMVVTKQRLVHGRGDCVLEEEMREAMAGIGRSQVQQGGEWKAAKHEPSKVSERKEVLGNLKGNCEKIWGAVVRQSDELARTLRRKEELGGRMQLEKVNRRLRKLNKRMKTQLARAEPRQPNKVARLQEAIAVGGSKVRNDLGNVLGRLTKLKQEIKRMKMAAKQIPLSLEKGKQRNHNGEESNVPNGVITHLMRECGGNMYDRIVDVTSRSCKSQLRVERDCERLPAEVLKQENLRLSDTKKLCPQGRTAPGLSSDFGQLIAVVGLRGGSRVTRGLSARGLANVAVRDWSDDFTFIVGCHHYRCPSSVSQFLSPRVSQLHSIDATISELRLEIEDRDELFASVLEAARGSSITVDSAHRPTFVAVCTALWNSELYESVYGKLSGKVMTGNDFDRFRFPSATRCDILAGLEFIASHFYFFLRRPDALKNLHFSILYEIIGRGSLKLESEDCLYDFISKGTETNREMFRLLEFVRFEYCSTGRVNDLFKRLSPHFYEINASMWAGLCTRLALPSVKKEPGRRFPAFRTEMVKDKFGRMAPQQVPAMTNGITGDPQGRPVYMDVPDGIIAHLTRECGGTCTPATSSM
jgi:hypothetical protein